MISQINLHKQLRHKYICRLQRIFEDEENVYMLLQLCSNGNMFELIKKRKKLTIQETQYYILQMIDALCYLHNNQIIHRDIKLGNLLINSTMQLKLADFGLATKLQFQGDRKHTVCGTPNYIAPQVIMSSMGIGISGHSYEVDIWSTGVIMYLMLIGRAPFQTSKLQKTYERISKAQFDFPDWFKDSSAKDLLRKMMVVDPSKRFTFQQVLSHQFLNPKNGIPKQIPVSSMVSAPKFQKYQKLQSSQIKRSARDFSIQTLRSQVDLSLDQNFEGLPSYSKKNEKSKDVKGLLKTVLSSSSLSRSLQKLGNICRSISPSNKVLQGLKINKQQKNRQSSRQAVGRQRIQTMASTTSRPMTTLNPHIYVLIFKKQIIGSYLLSSGYIGTYEPNYKLLYNKTDELYFQAEGQNDLKRIKNQNKQQNQNIFNRKKFIAALKDAKIQCQPFINTARIVYLKKTFSIKQGNDNITLFRLSNGHIQIHKDGLNKQLLITQTQLILFTLANIKQIQKLIFSKQNFIDSGNKDLINLYLLYKKISKQISQTKK